MHFKVEGVANIIKQLHVQAEETPLCQVEIGKLYGK